MKLKKKQGPVDSALRKKTRLSGRTPFNVREAYKITRTNIMFSLAQDGCKKIAFSSSYPGEGKTTTCTNLALSFGQMGEKVLVIDCDMRRPQVHNVFDLDNQVGLSNVLGGFAKISEAVHYLSEENISVITSGHIPPNPTELIGSERMKNLLQELGESYDYIFIDTPPVNMVADATILSQYISGIIMVTRQDETTHKDVELALGKLAMAKAKVLGFVMTGEKKKGGIYGKYGKYGRYGNYQEYAANE